MKYLEIFQFDIACQLKRISTWIYIAVMAGMSSLVIVEFIADAERGEAFFNAPITIAFITALSGVFGLLVNAYVSGHAAMRDIQERTESLVYTTAISKAGYLGARFTSALVINLMLLAAFMLGMFIVSLTMGFDTALNGPFRIESYVHSFFLFALPNSVITTGLLFSVAVLARRAMAAYLVAALLFFLTYISWDIISGELGKWMLGKHLDLSGLTVLSELRLAWTPLQKNAMQIGLQGSVLSNRFLWIAVTFCLMTITYLRFHFAHYTSRENKLAGLKKLTSGEPSIKIRARAVSTPGIARIFDLKTRWNQVYYLGLNAFTTMLQGKAWLIVPLLAIIVIFNSSELLEGKLGVPSIPATSRVIHLFGHMLTGLIMALLISFYAGELVWRERNARINELTDTAPVPVWVIFVSKFLALALIIISLQLVLLWSGIIIQVYQGYYDFNLWLYVRVLFGLHLADYLLFAILAFLVHVILNHKYVGHLIVFLCYFYITFPEKFHIEHNLLVFGSDPGWSYSEMSGFDPYITPWVWFKLYWLAWAWLFAVITNLFWVRGNEHHLILRIRVARTRLTGFNKRVLASSIALITMLGAFLFVNTNILNKYYTKNDIIDSRVRYEQNFGRYENHLQPSITAIHLQVDISPDNREVEINGRYQLINKTNKAIDTLHLSTPLGIQIHVIVFNRPAKTILTDKELGHHIFYLSDPLQPGDTLMLNFSVDLFQKGFNNYGHYNDIVKNGTYLHSDDIMPRMGYQSSRQVSSATERRKYGLPPRASIPPLSTESASVVLADQEKVHLDVEISTSLDQTAVTSGTLLNTWIANGKRYFHYDVDTPIRNGFALFSADYEIRQAKWKNVAIEIFYHPGHGENIDLMVKSTQACLDYYSENFGPYPHQIIRLIERPSNPSTGLSLRANPVNISFTEDFSFFAPGEDYRQFDFPFAVVAHEVAHQWWGNLLIPAHVEGAPLLSESLAWYSAMMVVEETYGPDHLEQLLWVMRSEYITPRSSADVPLMYSYDWFNAYRKGPFAMYALRKYLGEENMNAALKNLLEKYHSGEPPLPTSLDLYMELENVTPDSLCYLLQDLLARNTFWELGTEKVVSERINDSEWQLSLDVVARKVVVDTAGVETEIEMNDLIEIGAYDAYDPEKILYSRMHRICSGRQQIVITTKGKPGWVGIDPQNILIDLDPDDNMIKVSDP